MTIQRVRNEVKIRPVATVARPPACHEVPTLWRAWLQQKAGLISVLFLSVMGAAALLIAGCNASAPTTVGLSPQLQVEPAGPTEVTLYLAGMNKRLKIL